MTNENIRPIYTELQGYLSQAPNKDKVSTIYDANLWEHVNHAIDELGIASEEDYGHFKMIAQRSGQRRIPSLNVDTYRTKLGGLISRLHGKYFSDEPGPFRGMPSTVISQSQQ